MTRSRSSRLAGICVAAACLVGAAVAFAQISSIDDAANVSESAVRISTPFSGGALTPLPGDTPFDYQIGGDYQPPVDVSVVSRDWFAGSAVDDGYAICYVNAFQTQPDGDGGRPDERSNWPADLVLTGFEDDPNWDGEYLIDISTPQRRSAAAVHLVQMIEACARKGFDAVEYDNLDSWTRLSGLPFDRADTTTFAEMITTRAHALGLAVGQKNTAELLGDRRRIGFDFAVVEECGQFDECTDFTAAYGDQVVAIEYTDSGFMTACDTVGAQISVVRRDVDVSKPGSSTYVYDEC